MRVSVLGTNLPDSGQDLSPLQRRTLEVLLATKAWGAGGAINVNWNNQLDAFLVPSDRDHLTRYLADAPLHECLPPHLQARLRRVREKRS